MFDVDGPSNFCDSTSTINFIGNDVFTPLQFTILIS